MRPRQAIRTITDQARFYSSLRGSFWSRWLYFSIYYFCWIVLRWGDRHARALRFLKKIGLSDRLAEITLPDGLRLVIDQFAVHHILYSICRENVYAPRPDFEVKEGQTVLDIGAHQGIFTCRAGRKAGSRGLVIAFEPHPGNRRLLERNVALNGLTNVRVCGEAISEKPGTLELREAAFSGNHSTVLQGDGGVISVPVLSLDAAAERQAIAKADLMKIDIEGAALAALRGGQAFIQRSHPRIVMEYEIPADRMEIVSLLEGSGYKVEVEPGYLYASAPGRT